MRAAGWLVWGAAGVVVTLLAMRFGMRAVGILPDLPLPGIVYGLTAPLVQPFYRFAPVTERFDRAAIEIAAVAAAGAVLTIALALYVALLLVADRRTVGSGKTT